MMSIVLIFVLLLVGIQSRVYAADDSENDEPKEEYSSETIEGQEKEFMEPYSFEEIAKMSEDELQRLHILPATEMDNFIY